MEAQNLAQITDALRSTPFRNDNLPIQLANFIQELETRAATPPADAPALPNASDLYRPYVHEATIEPGFEAHCFKQHVDLYQANCLVVKFTPNYPFKALDMVVLSPKEDLSFDELLDENKAAYAQNVLDIVQPLDLRDQPWFTNITESKAKSGAIYVHYFYFVPEENDAKKISRKHVHFKVYDPANELPQPELIANAEEIIRSQKRGSSQKDSEPTYVPDFNVNAALSAAVTTNTAIPYKRLFITLAGSGTSTWKPLQQLFACINVDMDGNTPGKYDYIALADHKPTHAKDYMTGCWQYVSSLGAEGYVTSEWCVKSVNMDLSIADFEMLEKLYIFYGGWVNGAWAIIGDPVPFKAQLHWMTDTLPDIGQYRLHEIAIPGTHDSGTYDMYAKGFTINGQAQNMDFTGQLTLGIRYFDCRFEKWSGHTVPYYFYHSVAKTWTTIEDLVKNLKTFFATNHSQDIVILDFTHFSAFERNTTTDDYTALFNYIKSDADLSKILMTPNEARDLTINQLHGLDKRILMLAGDDDVNVAKEVDAIRAAFNLGQSINLTSQWPETHDLTDLKTKLDKQIKDNAGQNFMWNLQGILTPRALDSLAWWAQELYPLLRKWMVNDWPTTTNVVMCDFPGGTDIVHAAQQSNSIRNASRTDGNIYWYEDKGWNNPANGGIDGKTEIGIGGWKAFKAVFSANNGQIFTISWNGTLQCYHDANWQQAIPQTLKNPALVSSSDWQNYRQVFASVDGNVYAIVGNFESWGTGKLMRWNITAPNTLGTGKLIDAGWEDCRIAFASSGGTIYKIIGNYMSPGTGKLIRYTDNGGDKLGQGVEIDGGWENYRLAFASGNGLIYAINANGELWRWRDTGVAKLANGILIAEGWANVRMATATNDGRIYAI
ncbi:tachylectin-related carbohydrate-binding protein [Taibaiella soli]|uniref:Tachylectin 2 domain-containing protein n=1 Tax=Taibaiella soli TaxID=1649169 RepID=A0A2W2ADS4_9BACT|nr:tachylectin-related carbohydrate-binding protein [Taibaiella soli]PZF73605.1 hypothetical protein DN068_07740 [Taibaiella soli]